MDHGASGTLSSANAGNGSGPLLLTIGSYNIHRCIGVDGQFDPARVAAVIRSLDADIIGLQEVDSGVFLPDEDCQIEYLARATGYQPLAGPTIKQAPGTYGNVVLSRYPIVSCQRLDLSVRDWEPRGALDVVLDVYGLPVRVIVTHLGLRPSERILQVNRLMLELGADREVVLIMGDFNEWLPVGRSVRRIDERMGRAPAPRSFPSRKPLFALDRIWVQPRAALCSLTVVDTPHARVASDHLPLKAIVDLSKACTDVTTGAAYTGTSNLQA